MKLLHIQTVMQSTFGFDDGSGNVIPHAQVTEATQVLSEEAFAEARKKIEAQRDEAAANYLQSQQQERDARAQRRRPKR